MIRAIAIDDEPLALQIITHFCGQIDFVSLEKTFTKQSEAIKHLNKYPVDLLFLDIQMPNKNGIDFYKLLESDVMVIFTTAHSEFAVEGFNVNATDYLLKPFSFERFEVAVQKARNEFQFKNNTAVQTHLMIRADYKLHRIEFEDILLIEGLDDYIQIHLKNKSKIVARISMKGLLEKLPETKFMRVHRSYIIPISKVKTIQNKVIQIDEFSVPIGETYKDEILKKFD
ncbi:LytR/AlgR family response regulator transcription factor [Flavobacterium wongokense]|uniref:LytR/AlgR family response regulator transcription factor n=1 Tax=Flavobacterium wongokense TaxID=2910674 RepID=UPI001F411CC7|nr:LytTR family DNA-binding domain-containing protein [Flavobacterium sp. WG47]MCF6131147.1 LytTR family DNA-binding domain-containing protein [Flavobacterium sp. WG47]